jgi:hypothetical protein
VRNPPVGNLWISADKCLAARALWLAESLAQPEGLHSFLTVYIGSNLCRPQATYVNSEYVWEPLVLSVILVGCKDGGCRTTQAVLTLT